MKLPIIRSLTEKAETDGSAKGLEHAAEVIEILSVNSAFKEAELDVLGEVLSNLLGAVEVYKLTEQGSSKSEALNHFMKRVMGSIDR